MVLPFKTHFCARCGKTFANSKALHNHHRSHNDPVKCAKCAYQTRYPANLSRHEKTVHSNGRSGSPGQSRSSPSPQPGPSHHFSLKERFLKRTTRPKIRRSASTGQDNRTTRQFRRFHSADNAPKTVGSVDDFYDPALPYPSVRKYYNVEVHRVLTSKRLHLRSVDWKITFNDLENIPIDAALETSGKILENLMAGLTAKCKPADEVQFTLQSPALDVPISIPRVSVQENSVEMLQARIAAVAQSKRVLRLDQHCSINFVHVEGPAAGHRKKRRNAGAPSERTELDMSKYLTSKRCIVQVYQHDKCDKLCVARCLFLGIYRHKNPNKSLITYNRSSRLTEECKKLHEECGIPENELCGLEEVAKFQSSSTFRDKYEISVFAHDCARVFPFNSTIADSDLKKIRLYFYQEHCSLITDITQFLNRSYYCEVCKRGFNCKKRGGHRCKAAQCKLCRKPKCKNTGMKRAYPRIQCDKCDDSFNSKECYKTHIITKDCEKFKVCKVCLCLVRRTEMADDLSHPHCGERFCNKCQKFVSKEEPHYCYIPIFKPSNYLQQQQKSQELPVENFVTLHSKYYSCMITIIPFLISKFV